MLSYLNGQTQAVNINNILSLDVPLSIEVPQGSALGPFLFLVYPLSLKGVINKYASSRHGFAYDTQLYSWLSVKDTAKRNFQVNTMDNCIASVRSLMTGNKLKQNNAKTEITVVASSHNQCRLRYISIKTGEAIVTLEPNINTWPTGNIAHLSNNMHDKIILTES